MTKRQNRLGTRRHRQHTSAAMRYVLGVALVLGMLIAGAPPAQALVQLQADCDGWSFDYEYEPGGPHRMYLSIDNVPQGGVGLGTVSYSDSGTWFQDSDHHSLDVEIHHSGTDDWSYFHAPVSGCSVPLSTTTTTTTTPPTTTTTVQPPTSTTTTKAPTPTTTTRPSSPTPSTTVATAPNAAQPSPGTTLAPTRETTDTASDPTATLQPSTTFGGATPEPDESDGTVLAAVGTEPPPGSSKAPLLIGLLSGMALAVVASGAWYLGRRSNPS